MSSSTNIFEIEMEFKKIDEILHNWEMVSLNERVDFLDCSLLIPFKKVGELVINKGNYTPRNLQRFIKYRTRLYELEHLQFDEKIELKDRMTSYIIADRVSEVLEDFLDSFIKRHKIIDEDAKPFMFDENLHIELSKIPPLLNLPQTSAPIKTTQTKYLKLKWNGTPSQFGFIIDLLIQGGYIEKPTSSFPKDANFYLQFIDIKTTITTLTKELSESTNSLAPKNRTKIIIPHKDKLD